MILLTDYWKMIINKIFVKRELECKKCKAELLHLNSNISVAEWKIKQRYKWFVNKTVRIGDFGFIYLIYGVNNENLILTVFFNYIWLK